MTAQGNDYIVEGWSLLMPTFPGKKLANNDYKLNQDLSLKEMGTI